MNDDILLDSKCDIWCPKELAQDHIRAIDTLLCVLYAMQQTVISCETAAAEYAKRFPKARMISGSDRAVVGLYIAFANYAYLVGGVLYRLAIELGHNLPGRAEYLADLLGVVLPYRHKVAAHLAASSANKADSDPERVDSYCLTHAFVRGYLVSPGMCVHSNSVGKSEILPWSMSHQWFRIYKRILAKPGEVIDREGKVSVTWREIRRNSNLPLVCGAKSFSRKDGIINGVSMTASSFDSCFSVDD